MQTKITKFTKGTNAGTEKCNNCGKRTWKSKLIMELCEACNEEAMNENAHADGHHDAVPEPTCWECQQSK